MDQVAAFEAARDQLISEALIEQHTKVGEMEEALTEARRLRAALLLGLRHQGSSDGQITELLGLKSVQQVQRMIADALRVRPLSQ